MKFLTFSNTATEQSYTYSYTKRGTEQLYCPDKMRERTDGKASYDKSNGNLFYNIEVSWRGEILLDKSVDLNVDLGEDQFVDHVSITQSDDSRPGSIEIFTKEDGHYKKIADYRTGEHITEKDITIPVGYYCNNIVVRFNGAFESVGIKKFDICSATGIKDTLYPIPQNITMKEGYLGIDRIKAVKPACPEAVPAAKYLIERFKEKCNLDVVMTDSDAGILMSLSDLGHDGFEMDVNESNCTIQAGCTRGFVYAVDALVQLTEAAGIKQCTVSDKPMMEFRGVHLALPARADIPFLMRFIREVAVPMRYNTVLIQVSAAMRYDNYPEINEMWLKSIEKYKKGEWPCPAHYPYIGGDILEKSEVADLCSYIRSFGLEIVPEVQCLSHAQYITTAYPKLAEVEEQNLNENFGDLYMADSAPSDLYPHNMCPLHEEYYDYVFGIADEVVECMKPERYLHMGHDEGYIMGACPKCAKEDKARLFADEVTKLNEYVKSKNLQMMIWSDMLQSEYRFDTIYTTPEAINYVPKDVIMLDFTWYFHPELDLEDKLLNRNFTVAFGNLYSSHFPRYDYRSKRDNIMGGELSMWIECNENSYTYEGKMYDMHYTGNMLWNSSYDSNYRLSYNELVKPLLWNAKCAVADICTEGDCTAVAFDGDIRNIPNELLWQIPYEKAAVVSAASPELEIAVDQKADTLFITHATDLSVDRIMWKPTFKLAEYELVYEDGSVAATEIGYGLNICKHSQTYGAPIASILFRHQGYIGTYSCKPICGKDVNGKDYTLLEMPLKNPNPEKTIRSIRMKHKQNTDAAIVIYDVKAVKC